jgi:hypothetical protein
MCSTLALLFNKFLLCPKEHAALLTGAPKEPACARAKKPSHLAYMMIHSCISPLIPRKVSVNIHLSIVSCVTLIDRAFEAGKLPQDCRFIERSQANQSINQLMKQTRRTVAIVNHKVVIDKYRACHDPQE